MKTHRLRHFPFRIDAAIVKNEAFRQEARRIFTDRLNQQLIKAGYRKHNQERFS